MTLFLSAYESVISSKEALSMQKKVTFIINPMSASGKTGQRWPSLAPKVSAKFPNSEFIFTQASGEAEQLTQQAIQNGSEQIVAVGGDGTMNEVVNGYFKSRGESDAPTVSPTVSLGLLAMGTGSDLCKSLGIPKSFEQALNILQEEPVLVDCGRVQLGDQVRYFDNIASLGISGDIARHFEEHGKDGAFSYVTGLFKSARAYAKRGFSMSYLDECGQWQDHEMPDAFIAIIANAQYFGGGMHIAPKAMMNDGLFHCVMVKSVSAFEIMRYLPAIFKGKHLKHPPFHDFQASEIKLSATVPSWLEIDGEPCFQILANQSVNLKVEKVCLALHLAPNTTALIKKA